MTVDMFSQHFKVFSSALRAFAMHLTKDKVEADDLYQDTVYKAIRYRHLYQPQTNLQAWMMTIMRNTFINDWRRQKRKQQLVGVDIKGVTLTQTSATANGGEHNINMQELMGMVNQLEDGLRIPFLMAFKGYKYEEIAEQMQLPLGTVKSRIHQARKSLRDEVKRFYRADSLVDLLSPSEN
ncbi:MAG: RNA polymerase sigma factor [Saprospiraceae bacterium]